MPYRLYIAAWIAVAALVAAPAAFAQVSDEDLLRADPNGPNALAPGSMYNDETTPQGVTRGKPDFTFDKNEPVTMQADEMGYDKENEIIIARGNVEVVQGLTVMNADQLTYFQRRNLVQASGNVSMLQPSGDVYFAEYVELRDDMKKGVIHNFRARLADNSLFAAREARKVNQNVTELKKAVYTPCKLCKDSAPFWQMKASDVQIDEADERVRYANAHMEMFGIPMFYTPVLSHPTPDSQAESGFLTPEYSASDNLGTMVKVPFYWRIDHDKDVTLIPWYGTEEGLLLQGDYRQVTDGGYYNVRFSGTNPTQLDSRGRPISGNEFRGHIYAQGSEAITPYSRVGFDINRSTDDTYLRRYGFGSQRVLFSRVYAEAAKNRNYALAQGVAMQGLRRTDDADVTPLVLPTLEGYYETEPFENGMTLHAFANAQSLTREEGADSRRLSMSTGATLPMVTDGGHIFTASANVRQDLYSVDNVPINNGAQLYDGSVARTIPQAALEWRYPLIRGVGADALTVEPIMLAVVQPNGQNPQEIPNEENTLIELTDTNLFSLDRMPGLDTVDSGSRFVYGFRSQYLFAEGHSVDTMLGQSYSIDDDTPFPNSTRQGKNVSDVIGSIAVNYYPVSFGYRFAVDRETLTSNRTEFTATLSKPWLSLAGVYRALENNRYLADSEEGIVNASMPLTDEWSIYGGGRRNLETNQMVATNMGLLYRNECFSLILQSLRRYTRDRDIEPSTEFTVRVGFKNLGEFGDQ